MTNDLEPRSKLRVPFSGDSADQFLIYTRHAIPFLFRSQRDSVRINSLFRAFSRCYAESKHINQNKMSRIERRIRIYQVITYTICYQCKAQLSKNKSLLFKIHRNICSVKYPEPIPHRTVSFWFHPSS